ncbi:MAG: sodium/solute symporter [Thermoguttaceae bacterium]|jgi:SSS family solute:Na+ symporter|nr:sodium/solute symporter [Thermoguttaceae bacterium]
MNAIDVAIIIGSLAVVVFVGLRASRGQDPSAKGYFLASGKMPWWLIGAGYVATSVSSEQIVGTVGATYTHGMGIANWEWFAPNKFIILLFFIPIYLRSRITTIPDLLARRYGPLCSDIYSWVMLVAYVFIFMPPVLYGGSLAFSKLAGWDFYVVLWTTVVLVALYTVQGGLKAVMWTDAVQCVMLIGGGALLFFVALWQVPGGWPAMVEASPERFHLVHPPDDPMAPFLGFLAATVGLFLFYSAGSQVMIQRVLCARSTWDGMMGILFSCFINLFRPLVTCFLGLVVFHWIHVMHMAEPLENADTTFPFALAHMAPEWGLRGIVLTGFLAAVMSTISSLSNSTATIFSLDVYKRLIHPGADDARVVLTGKAVAMFSLIIAGLVAPFIEHVGLFQYFQKGVTYLATPFISVILMGFFWKRSNYAAGLFGIVGGLAIQLGIVGGLQYAGITLHWLYAAFIAQVIIMAGMFAISLVTEPPAREQWEPFFWRPDMLRHIDGAEGRPWYQTLTFWSIVFVIIWGFLYYWFW